MPFDSHDLLRQAAYADGEFIPLMTVESASQTALSTSSTSFVGTDAFHEFRNQWDLHFPAGSPTSWVTFVTVLPGTDETVDVRVQNTIDNETVHETTGISSTTNLSMGPTDYTPTTTDGRIIIRLQIRTDPGNNSSSLRSGHETIGVVP